MESGRMPACVVPPSRGPDNTSVPINVLTGADLSQKSGNTQVFVYGNRCDHDKNNFKRPDFLRNAKRRPHVLEESKRRITSAIHDNFRYSEFTGLFYHSAADNKSGRHRRSESVEGILSLALPTLLQTLNLHRMACGFYDNRNQFHYFNYAYLQDKSDQNSSRFKREMAILQAEKIIKVITTRKSNNDGTWRTTSVQIEFTDKIFQMLDLMDDFLRDRETIAIRFHEKQSRLDNNRAKREFYRKKTFPDKKPSYLKKQTSITVAKQEVSLQSCIKRASVPQSGRGYAIKQRMEQLKHQGFTPIQIMDFLKKEFPPPS